jgi:hypothetical protein
MIVIFDVWNDDDDDDDDDNNNNVIGDNWYFDRYIFLSIR